MKRMKMSKRKSRKNFRAGAKVKSRNYSTGNMRGGIRL